MLGFINKKDRRLGVAQDRRQYDLPLNKSIGTGFMVTLIALMTFLAVMALGLTITAGSMAERWSSGLENKATIEIPAEKSSGGLRSRQDIATLTTKLSSTLQELRYVKSSTILKDDDIKALIEPWLGDAAILDDIPLPGLISVAFKTTTPEIIKNLKKKVEVIDKDIKVDTHENWLSHLLRLTSALQFSALFILLIISATTITAVAGAMRTRMAVHSEEVELLHLMGAGDEYITKQLQRHAFIMGVKGSLIGIIAGLIMIVLISYLAGDTGTALLPEFNITPSHVLSMIAVPILICLSAALAARFTVLRVLAEMP